MSLEVSRENRRTLPIRTAIAAAILMGCGAKTGLNIGRGSTSVEPSCQITNATFGTERRSANTPEALPVVTGFGFVRASTATPQCLDEVADAVRMGYLEISSPRGRAVEQGSTFGSSISVSNSRDRYVQFGIQAENLAALYGLSSGIPNRTDINDRIRWTLHTHLGNISGNSFYHLRSSAWTCNFSPNRSGNVQRNQLGAIRFSFNYASDSIPNATLCFGLSHPNNNINAQLQTAVTQLQQPSGSCLLDQPNACAVGQVCSTNNQCVDSRWCQNPRPGEVATFTLPQDVQDTIATLGLPFRLQPTLATSSAFPGPIPCLDELPVYLPVD